MRTMRISEARDNLYKLVNQTIQTHEPITITSKHGNVVMIGEEEWRAVEETLYLLSVPGMRESIVKGMKTPVEKCSNTLNSSLESSLYKRSSQRRKKTFTSRSAS